MDFTRNTIFLENSFYLGLGDLFVVLFFGLVAVGGTYYLHTLSFGWAPVVAGLQVGFLATVLIAINNLRDVDQDAKVNKKTLAVRCGKKFARAQQFKQHVRLHHVYDCKICPADDMSAMFVRRKDNLCHMR